MADRHVLRVSVAKIRIQIASMYDIPQTQNEQNEHPKEDCGTPFFLLHALCVPVFFCTTSAIAPAKDIVGLGEMEILRTFSLRAASRIQLLHDNFEAI